MWLEANRSDLSVQILNQELVGLAFDFKVNPNSCGNPEYFEQYLRFCAISDNAAGKAVTHVAIDTKTNQIAGYVSLRAASLIVGEEGEPALEIYNLAVDNRYEHQGIGRILVDTAIAITASLNENYIGVRNLLLASEPKAVGFYKKCGFESLQDYYRMLKEHQNQNCIAMMMRLCN